MTKPKQAKGGRKAIVTPDLDSFIAYTDELGRESDRGAVLVAATRIDELLKAAIAPRLVHHPDTSRLLEGFNAPLSSFSARILAAFALRIIHDREYHDCQIIRKVRNEFAHKLSISFADRRIVDLVQSLDIGVKAVVGPTACRRRFTSSAVTLAGLLNRRAEWVSRERLVFRNWGFTDLVEQGKDSRPPIGPD